MLTNFDMSAKCSVNLHKYFEFIGHCGKCKMAIKASVFVIIICQYLVSTNVANITSLVNTRYLQMMITKNEAFIAILLFPQCSIISKYLVPNYSNIIFRSLDCKFMNMELLLA